MKVAVVIRQLKGARPAVLCLIKDPNDLSIDNLEHYFKDVAADKIADFKKQFVEFEYAEFYTDIIEMY